MAEAHDESEQVDHDYAVLSHTPPSGGSESHKIQTWLCLQMAHRRCLMDVHLLDGLSVLHVHDSWLKWSLWLKPVTASGLTATIYITKSYTFTLFLFIVMLFLLLLANRLNMPLFYQVCCHHVVPAPLAVVKTRTRCALNTDKAQVNSVADAVKLPVTYLKCQNDNIK